MWTWARNFETQKDIEKYIYREWNVKKKKIEDVCVSMDDLHEIEFVQHCA